MNRRLRSVNAAAHTDTGLRRTHNEDAFVCRPDLGIFAVIDGVGGEVAGETAAKKAAEVLLGRLARRTAVASQRLREAVTLANNAIFEQALENEALRGMACVLTVGILEGDQLTVGHVGDTRLYRLKADSIEKITHDHSPIGLLEEKGELSEREAMAHPRRSEILRDVGSEWLDVCSEDFVDVYELILEWDEAALFCSDGLTDQVTAGEILKIVERHADDPEQAVRRLVEAANLAGGRDNVTALLVQGEQFAGSLGDTRSNDFQAELAVSKVHKSVSARSARRALHGFLAVALVTTLFVLVPHLPRPSDWGGQGAKSLPTLRVGPPESTHSSIGQALDAADQGQVIEVAPGIYNERIELKDGVSLVSIRPRAAVIRISSDPGAKEPVAVLARGIRDARIEGFRIEGDTDHPLGTGLQLVDSSVIVEDISVTGAKGTGIEITGKDQSKISYSLVRRSGGIGISIGGDAVTRLHHNIVTGNGAGLTPRGAGIEILDRARPSLHGNWISGNVSTQVRGAPSDQLEEIALQNRIEGDQIIIPTSSESVTETEKEDLPTTSAPRESLGANGEAAGRQL